MLKGIPTQIEILAIDRIKKNLMAIKPSWSIEKTLQKFNEENLPFLPYNPDYMPDSAMEIGNMTQTFLQQMGVNFRTAIEFSMIIQHVIGYDLAYRLRIQDMLNEIEDYSNPRKELKRLWGIYKKRETVIPTYMIPKARKYFNIMLLSLLIPKVKRAFKYTLDNTDWDRIKFAEEDKEWIKIRTDYKFYA